MQKMLFSHVISGEGNCTAGTQVLNFIFIFIFFIKFILILGYPGGLREMPALKLKERFPERILEKAVWGMLPKNKLRHARFQKLKVFAEEHDLASDIVKKISPLPPHFTQREYVAEKLDSDDPMAHLRGFYIVRVCFLSFILFSTFFLYYFELI